jgi:hypothetical protein
MKCQYQDRVTLIGRPQPDCSQCFANYKATQKTVSQIRRGCRPEQAAWQHCFSSLCAVAPYGALAAAGMH